MTINRIFIFSHQDDEFGLFNVIEEATKKQNNVIVVYLTSGLKTKNQNSKNKELQRDKESLKVLLKLGVRRNNIFFLGKKLNIPIYKLYKNLNSVYQELNRFLIKFKGKHIIYTHSWEGGNEDHDASFVIVKKILNKNLKVKKVFEFSQYNNFKTMILPFKVQSIIPEKKKIYKNKIKIKNKIKYIIYLFNYISQFYLWFPIYPFIILRILMNDYGNLKTVKKNLFIKRPHRGKLLYEKLRTTKYEYFAKYFENFLSN